MAADTSGGAHGAATLDGFPRDDYTPHGYLANPWSFARSWSDGHGGNLRGTDDAVGFGWLYPWARGARAGAQLEIGLAHGEHLLLPRADFETVGLSAPHHSALLFEYAWKLGGASCRARFVLMGEDELGLEVELQGAASRGEAVTLYLALAGWRRDGEPCVAEAAGDDPGALHGAVDLGASFGTHALIVEADAELYPLGAGRSLVDLVRGDGLGVQTGAYRGERAAVGVVIPLVLSPATRQRAFAILRRAHDDGTAAPTERPPLAEGVATPPREPPRRSVGAAVEEARRRDDDFWRSAARLAGDWPASWRRGWVYDLETTRMCLLPPGGVFRDVWPAWMIQWPRAVLAEGTLDALRLSYADPALAKRAALSLLRDATAPNVPCVFRDGEPNMVAADGSVCGTSPAWCVPFYNLERLYLRTLDREWLAALYPLLAAYLDWWLAERTDSEGWAVYKCTWEAGEDDTPRLDPEGRGDGVVSDYVRPVELQATMALSAGVLARFADHLARGGDAAGWRSVETAFAARTDQLWDPAAGRFRDWDRRTDRFLEPTGRPNYWGIDPCRYSPLAFTPLLAELARQEQTEALARELEHYASPPWVLWASWSYVVLEAALAAGQRAFAARTAEGIVGRVYGELDRRTLGLRVGAPGGKDRAEDGRSRGPTPGIAREYWPLDLSTWDACEGYGWGATTASLLVRQVFGFTESPIASGVRFRLAPALPPSFLARAGRRYALLNVPYRGESLDLEYTVRSDAATIGGRRLEVLVRARARTACRVIDERGRPHDAGSAASEHRFSAEPGVLYEVELERVS